jgi:hypothetical protein
LSGLNHTVEKVICPSQAASCRASSSPCCVKGISVRPVCCPDRDH